MKLGFETVLFGRRFYEPERLFRMIAKAGYQGVEIAQSPAMLKRSGIADIHILLKMLKEAGEACGSGPLELIALAGGTLGDRVRFCGEFRPEYLYVENWDESCDWASSGATTAGKVGEKPFVLALHPHLFTDVHNLKEAEKLLEEHRELTFCPDTAHLAMVENPPEQAILKWAKKKRIIAMHLKDWRSQFGRYSHRYARGFVELGRGNQEIDWSAVVNAIKEWSIALIGMRKEGWLVVEVDSTRTTYWESLRTCSHWTHQNLGLPLAPPPEEHGLDDTLAEHFGKYYFEERQCLNFYKRLSDAETKDPESFYQTAAASFDSFRRQKRPEDGERQTQSWFKLAQIWLYTPSERRLDLMGVHSVTDFKTLRHMDFKATARPLCADVIESLETKIFDLRESVTEDDELLKRFRDRDLLQHLRDQSCAMMISVPVCNSWNTHHLRFIVNLFPDLENEEVKLWLAKGKQAWHKDQPEADHLFEPPLENSEAHKEQKNGSSHNGVLESLAELCRQFARASDSMLDERCISAGGQIQRYIRSKWDRNEFFLYLARKTAQHMGCKAAALFMVSPYGILEPRIATTLKEKIEIVWKPEFRPHACHYKAKQMESNMVQTWQNGEMKFLSIWSDRPDTDDLRKKMHSWEDFGETVNDCIFAPVFSAQNTSEVIAVVRLSNKKTPNETKLSERFTDDDAAVLDVIIQAARPLLDFVAQHDGQQAELGRLTHEFKAPLAAIRAALNLMSHSFQEKNLQAKILFGEDYPNDILNYTHLLHRLVVNNDVFRRVTQGEMLPLNCAPILLGSQVIAPAVAQVSHICRDRGLPFEKVQLTSLENIASVWVDKDYMQQVILNLLRNAIMHCDTPGTFSVKIRVSKTARCYSIMVEDRGPGVDPRFKNAIFEPRFRAPGAEKRDTSGQGLGLYVCRSIVEAHGGTIQLTSCGRLEPVPLGQQPPTIPKSTVFEIQLPLWLEYHKPN